MNVSYGISKMRKGFYAFHTELGVGYKLIKDTFLEHEKCGIEQMSLIQLPDPVHSAPKHSPYKEMFKVK